MHYVCICIVLLSFHHTLAYTETNALDAGSRRATSCTNDDSPQGRPNSNTTCTIECNSSKNLAEKSIDCGTTDTCIVHCTARMCLQNSKIYAANAQSLIITSSASNCIINAHIYLPNTGDVTILAYHAQSAFSSNTLYAGTSTNSIHIHCIGYDDDDHLCDDLHLDASTVQYVHLTVTSTSADGAYIVCPIDPNGACIINATDAVSLRNATVIALQRVTLYIGFKTDISKSRLECDDDAVMRYDVVDNSYYHGECLPIATTTTTSTTIPHMQSTSSWSHDSPEHTNPTTYDTEYNAHGTTKNQSSSQLEWEIMVGKVHDTGYLMIILLIGTPLLLVTFAAIYNVQFKGSDPPNFSNILKCFMNTADFYIDVIFCVLLLYKWSAFLFVCGSVCITISHVLSNCMAWYYINKWSKKKKLLYIQEYKALVVILSLIVGFYAAVQLLSSKLFYLQPFAMQLSPAQVYRIQIVTICNDVVFRNIPVIAIAVLSVMWNTMDNQMDIITTIAFISSLFMLITGSLTLLSRCISTRCRFKYNFACDNILMDVIVTSDTVQTHHQFCHRLFAGAVALSLGIASDRVETLLITPAEGGDGICCSVEILLIDDEDKVYRMIDDIQNNWDGALYNFKIALCKALYIIEMDVDIIIVGDKRDSASMQHQYKPLTHHPKEIEIVKLSTSLKVSLSLSGEGDDRKYNDSDCESTS